MESIPSLTQWVKDLVLLWLWCKPAAAAPIQPVAWELRICRRCDHRKEEEEVKKKEQSLRHLWDNNKTPTTLAIRIREREKKEDGV